MGINHEGTNDPEIAVSSATDWTRKLRQLGMNIRERIRDLSDTHSELTEPRVTRAGDTLFQLDLEVEPVIVNEVQKWNQPTTVIAEGLGQDGVLQLGAQESSVRFRCLIDPIDGTRGLMYGKRSAWFLAAVALNRGEETMLSDCFVSVMVELPTIKQAAADDFAAVSGQAVDVTRMNLQTHESQKLTVEPSGALDLEHGFAHVSNFFPGTKVLASELMESIVASTLSPHAMVFDDQYISSGGQMVELILGRDRFCCDLRPLFNQIAKREGIERQTNLECHPYDVAGALVARQAGVILTDGFGQPLDCRLNVNEGVHWCGYANESIRQQVAPVIQRWLNDKGVGM